MGKGKAKILSTNFKLNVRQSLYSDWGNFYGLIKKYPCALWDRTGYLLIENEDALKIPEISVGKRLNVPKGISSLKGYCRVCSENQIPEEISDNTKHYEGAVQKIFINRYERDKRAREKCLSHYGYSCQICHVELSTVYGEIADKLIHVHHLIPISKVGEEYTVDPISDLIPVCPNCHAILHLKNPPYTPNEVRSQIKNKASRNN